LPRIVRALGSIFRRIARGCNLGRKRLAGRPRPVDRRGGGAAGARRGFLSGFVGFEFLEQLLFPPVGDAAAGHHEVVQLPGRLGVQVLDERERLVGRLRGRGGGFGRLELLAVADGGGAEPDHHVGGAHGGRVVGPAHEPAEGEHAFGERVVQHLAPRPPQVPRVGLLVLVDDVPQLFGGFAVEGAGDVFPRLALGPQLGGAGDDIDREPDCGGHDEHLGEGRATVGRRPRKSDRVYTPFRNADVKRRAADFWADGVGCVKPRFAAQTHRTDHGSAHSGTACRC
jgi:hypothetical protein